MPSNSYERLDDAAVRGNSLTVPVPQRAFNQELLELDAEAFWGVREEDGAVVVSALYDPFQDEPGFRYLDSSVVDDDRMLKISDAVFDHWDELADGGTAVEGGDRLQFLTNDDLEANRQLVVTPEEQAADLLEGDVE